MNDTKICPRCKRELPASIEFFHRCKASPSGLRGECKECRKVESKTYVAQNRERIAEKGRQYRRENPELISAQRRKAYLQNRDEFLASQREAYRLNPEPKKANANRYRAQNPAKKAASDRAWRLANPEQCRANRQKWKRLNIEKVRLNSRAYQARRKAWKLGNGGVYTEADIRRQYESQQGRCWWCGEELHHKYDVDHRIALSKGGTNGPENIVCACEKCNGVKGAKMPWEFTGRLI